jgi:hypothetical protein
MHVEPGFVRVFSKYLHDNIQWLVAAPYRYFHDGA